MKEVKGVLGAVEFYPSKGTERFTIAAAYPTEEDAERIQVTMMAAEVGSSVTVDGVRCDSLKELLPKLASGETFAFTAHIDKHSYVPCMSVDFTTRVSR